MQHYSNSPSKKSGSSSILGFFGVSSYHRLNPTTSNSGSATFRMSPHGIAQRSPTTIQYGVLKNVNGDWEIKLQDGANQLPYGGPYDFVTMEDGEIRVQYTSDDASNHRQLAGNADKVICAGQLSFSTTGSCELLWWSNQSIDYPTDIAPINSGLPSGLYDSMDDCPEDLGLPLY